MVLSPLILLAHALAFLKIHQLQVTFTGPSETGEQRNQKAIHGPAVREDD